VSDFPIEAKMVVELYIRHKRISYISEAYTEVVS
jgi:hypothetical protein